MKVLSLFRNCNQIWYLWTFVSKNQKHKSLWKPCGWVALFHADRLTDGRIWIGYQYIWQRLLRTRRNFVCLSPLLVCVFFALGSGHCYSLLLFTTFGLVNIPRSCNVGSNDAYLSDSPYGCSGPSFSQLVKQKRNDVIPVFVPEPETAPFRGPRVSSQMHSVDRQKVCRRWRYCIFIYCCTGAATCITDVLTVGRVVFMLALRYTR